MKSSPKCRCTHYERKTRWRVEPNTITGSDSIICARCGDVGYVTVFDKAKDSNRTYLEIMEEKLNGGN